jgi:hypothetical protein
MFCDCADDALGAIMAISLEHIGARTASVDTQMTTTVTTKKILVTVGDQARLN